MNNSFRLSLFNLRKNRREAVGIAFLTLITTFLLATFAANITGINTAFDRSFDESGCANYSVAIKKDIYRDQYLKVLTDNYDVSEPVMIHPVVGDNTMVVDHDGKDRSSFSITFITEEEERKTEDFVKTGSLPEDEINRLEHPIWLCEYFSVTAGFEPGDTFTVLSGGKQYPFTVAGFYNGGLWCDTGNILRLIVSEDDKLLLSTVFDEYVMLFFDLDSGTFEYNEYTKLCRDSTGEHFDGWFTSREDLRSVLLQYIILFLYLSAFLSLITLSASLFMIRHKISKDIEDQMQQIGVLEALGYKSSEISLSYVYEYVITGGIGAVIGGIAAALFTPVMNTMSIAMMSRTVQTHTNYGSIFLVTLATVAAVILFALIKAGTVKRYPPVTAFRKGIKAHHFGKNILPLEHMKKNINLRLALKGIFTDMRTNIGVGLCITLAGIAMLFSAYCFDFFKNGSDNLVKMMGFEIADTSIELMDGASPEKMREELLGMPEVRKVLITTNWIDKLDVKGSDLEARLAVYDDYSQTENLFLIDGRFPEYDNEVAISYRRHLDDNVNIGDSIVIQGSCSESGYIVTGIVCNMAFSRSVLYLTTDGYSHVQPTSRPRTVNVYLNDGYSREEFENKLTALYGANVQDTMEAGNGGSDLEERIRRKADEKIALLISKYQVTDVDYAIRIGDTLIKGNSTRFIIKELSSLQDMVKVQCDPIANITKTFSGYAMIFIAVVVAVILGIITSSNVKRQRRELGIMKSMGYSSKDLMTQTALRIMPVALVSAVIAAIASVYINKYFWQLVFCCKAIQNYGVTVAVSIALVIFTYIVTYIGAGNIRKVSVTELMTE